MGIPNPNPNIADGIKCDNKTYSSNKIESLISTATELPVPAAGDEGKVLTVNAAHDGYELDFIPAELPATESADAGKVLTVNAAGDGYELDTPVDPTSIIDDETAGLDTVYSSTKVESLIPTVPQKVTLTAADVFEDVTNVASFDGYRYGDILIINRLVIENLTGSPSGETRIIQLKSAYTPPSGIRIVADPDGTGSYIRAFYDVSGYILVNGTYTFNKLFFAGFTVML